MTTNSMRTYVLRTIFFMTGYIAANAAAMTGAFDDVQRPGAYLLGLAVAGPVVGQIWALLDCMRTADEYIARFLARIFILAAGLTIATFASWGFAEAYVGAPHIPGWFVYPLFWWFYGISWPIIRRMG